MEGAGQWRLIEPQETSKEEPTPAAAESRADRSSFLLIVVTTALVVAAAGIAIWATLPAGTAVVQTNAAIGGAVDPLLGGDGTSSPAPGATALVAAVESFLVVDVQGAVARPGLHTLPAGSRIGDAISVAGGYAASVDIAAASRQLNLAAKLADGAQVRVPALGDEPQSVATTPAVEPGGSSGSGLIDVNNATAEQLDTLPGIGPVTAAEIIDARAQAPFAAVEELLARGVVGASTFEKIRDLVTVGQ